MIANPSPKPHTNKMQTSPVSLQEIIQAKESTPLKKTKLSQELGQWLSNQLNQSGEDHQLYDCDTQFYSYSRITLQRNLHGIQASLEIKIGEIDNAPFYFADVRLIGHYYRPMLPVSGPLSSAPEKNRLLNYIADFVLGVRSGEIEKNPRFSDVVNNEYPKASVV